MPKKKVNNFEKLAIEFSKIEGEKMQEFLSEFPSEQLLCFSVFCSDIVLKRLVQKYNPELLEKLNEEKN